MPTLSEWAKNETNMVARGIYENIITHNELMPFLQFKSVAGNAFQYSRESTLPTTSTHAVGDTWEDTEPTFTQKTASLTIVGDQTNVDRYIAQTRNASNDPRAIAISQLSKSLSRKLQDLIITGEPTSTSTHWEGLDSLVRSETRMRAMDDGVLDGPGTAETELTLDRLDQVIDDVEAPNSAKVLIMNKTMRRKLSSLLRAAGSGVEMTQAEMFGHQIMTYGHLPIVVNDFITNAEVYDDSGTWPSSTATTIFVVTFGEENQGYTILHNGPVMMPEIQDLGIKFNKNENVYRMLAYLQAITFSAKKVAALGGIDSAA